MELRGQDQDLGMPSSTLGYNPPNRESASKLSSPHLASTVGEKRSQTAHGNTIFNPPQTPDHDHLYHLPHQFNPPQQPPHKPRRDPDPKQDPVPAQIVLAASETSTLIDGVTNLTSPPPPPPQQPQPPPPLPTSTTNSASSVRYRECLKNHAACMGRHVVDGCGEFMPSGKEGTLEALKCAACECHRNFHRKEMEGKPQHAASNRYHSYNSNKNKDRMDTNPSPQHPPLLPPQRHRTFSHGLSISPSMGPIAPMMMVSGGSGGALAESSSEDLNMFQSNAGVKTSVYPPLSKKRFRTKFTQEQKDRMMELAEKLGWKIQKQDEQEVQQFCAEVGVKRQVFKVWMHNNKQAVKKMQL